MATTTTVLYLLNNTDDSRQIAIQPYVFDGAGGVQRNTDLTFYGNGTPRWGERFNENFFKLLENFAVAEAGGTDATPSGVVPVPQAEDDPELLGEGLGINYPVEGQLWYNKSRGVMFTYTAIENDGAGGYQQGTTASWKPSGNVMVVDSEVERDAFLPTPRPGELVFRTDTGLLDIHNGTAWTTSGSAYVLKAGDTMTGFLTLHSVPTADLHAATKGYVDSALGGGVVTDHGALTGLSDNDHPQYLYRATGGTVSGPINMSSQQITSLGTPTTNYDAATKLYVDQGDADRVLRAGDGMTGFLFLYDDPTLPLHAATKQYVDSNGGSGAQLLASGTSSDGSIVLFPATYDASTSFIIVSPRVYGADAGGGIDYYWCYATAGGTGWTISAQWSRENSGGRTGGTVNYWVLSNGAPATGAGGEVAISNQDINYSTTGTTGVYTKYRLDNDGIARDAYGSNTVSEVTSVISGEWLVTGAVGDFEVYVSQTSGTAVTGDTLDTWLSLGTSRSWRVTTTYLNPVSATLSVSIREVASGVILDNATIVLTQEALV